MVGRVNASENLSITSLLIVPSGSLVDEHFNIRPKWNFMIVYYNLNLTPDRLNLALGSQYFSQ